MDCFASLAMTNSLGCSDGSPRPLDARLRRAADVEDAAADDAGARTRYLCRRAARARRPQRRGDPAAAHVYDGSDLGDRDAVLHLLGCAVRRRHHLDPFQHSRGGVVGGDHLRRLSDGAAGQGGGSADGGVHVVVHRLSLPSCSSRFSRLASRRSRCSSARRSSSRSISSPSAHSSDWDARTSTRRSSR